jgi:pilus assembly protein CpaB
MSIRTLATLGVAIFLGVIAVVLVRTYLGNATRTTVAQTGSEAPTVSIVVAARPLARGAVLQADALKVVNYPQDAAPVEAFHAIGEVVGGENNQRVALRAMVANEPILAGNVSGAGGRLGLSGVVAPGMRAASLRSGDVAGVGGFVLPGDRVDILLTRTSGNDQSATVTQILAENVRVLGVDQSDNVEANKPVVAKVVTVEVTPDQAQAISLGQSVGTITLTLRHVADDAPLIRKVTTVSDLGGGGPRRTGYSVRVIRGVESSSNAFSASVGNGLKQAAAASAMPAAMGAP